MAVIYSKRQSALVVQKIAERQRKLTSRVVSKDSTPPVPYSPLAWVSGENELGYYNPLSGPAKVDESECSATFLVTSIAPDEEGAVDDRDGDVVIPKGIRTTNFKHSPLWFFGHQSWQVPIGKATDKAGKLCWQVTNNGNDAISTCFFDQGDPLAMYLFGKVARGFLKSVSIAFVPKRAYRREVQEKAVLRNAVEILGWVFEETDLTEISLVGVGANQRNRLLDVNNSTEWIRESLDKEAKDIPLQLQKAMRAFVQKRVWSPGSSFCPSCEDVEVEEKGSGGGGLFPKTYVVGGKVYDPLRWNTALSKEFEVENEQLDPSSTTYDWVSRYLECPIKKIYESSTSVPSFRMGSFLTGLRYALREGKLKDVRNINGNSESPPVYETIQLNSKRRDSFLIHGASFYEMAKEGRFVVKIRPDWGGVDLTIFTKQEHAQFNQSIFDTAWEWAKQNNFLKGEAFALSGKFLERTEEGWDDVFLEEKNKKTMQRTLNLFNEKGLGFATRGVILTGPPGSGKTLASRILRNQAKGTFIWLSSRDFHKSGGFGGLAGAFDLARELAPSIIVAEDVDNWLDGHTIDFLKSEMDGCARFKGVLTVLTTNFPELLPDALIDRPGRFHDVLKFDLPDASARFGMLSKWLPNIGSEAAHEMVEKTDGYSGAHVYELAHFASTLHEHDGIDPVVAVKEALKKVEEQRDLITQLQLEGSNYNPLRRTPRRSGKAMKKTKSIKSQLGKSCDCDSCKSGKPCPCGHEEKEVQADMEASGQEPPAGQTGGQKGDVHQECVGHKIPKLLGEGYERDQAAAIAYSMCGEGKKGDDIAGHEEYALRFGIEKGAKMTDEKDIEEQEEGEEKQTDFDSPDEVGDETEAPSDDMSSDQQSEADDVEEDLEDDEKNLSDPKNAPFGARFLAQLIQHFQNALEFIRDTAPQLENEDLKKFAETHKEDEGKGSIHNVLGELNDLAGKHYPDHDMQSLVAEAPENQGQDSKLQGEAGAVENGATVDAGGEEGVQSDPGPAGNLGADTTESTEELLQRYQQAPNNAKAALHNVVIKTIQKNKLGGGHYEIVRDAGQHMYDLAKAPDLPRHHVSGLIHHSDKMGALCKELEASITTSDKPAEGGDEPEDDVEVSKRLEVMSERLSSLVFQATGQKI